MGVKKHEKNIFEKRLYICSSKYESLGLTVLEAMDAGIPVIGFDDWGVNQILTNNKNGILVKVKKTGRFTFSEIDKLMHSTKIYKLIRKMVWNILKIFIMKKFS